jgi:hypothetical protein
MTFAKGFFLGSLGCFAGCLITSVLLFVVLGVGFSACAAVIPILAGAAAHRGVELEITAQAPENAVDLIVDELRAGAGSAPDGLVSVSVEDGRRAWLVFASHGLRTRSNRRERDRVAQAVAALEDRGSLPRGSVEVRSWLGVVPGVSVEYHDFEAPRDLPTKPSKR